MTGPSIKDLEQYKGRKYRKYFCATGAYELFGDLEKSPVYTVTDGYIGRTYKNEPVLFLMSQDENGETDIISLTEFNRPRASIGAPGIRWWAEWEPEGPPAWLLIVALMVFVSLFSALL